ncbi:MAG: SCO1664 family protein [Nocardioidaceae bacterium]
MSEGAETRPPVPSPDEELVVLREGHVEIEGRIMPASNATFFGTVTLGEHAVQCVYKPVAGERPLWDFPDGTLANREVAAYAVSQALGWDVVPPTILREGPVGPGMVQAWREPDPAHLAVDLVREGAVPAGYLHVLDAYDSRDRPVSLVHEDTEPLRRMAVFDVVVNNADRKGGHVLAMTSGHRYGVDHGVSFHVEDKLRTVLWGWAGEPLERSEVSALTTLVERLAARDDELDAVLAELLAPHELAAVVARCADLLAAGTMPLPSERRPAIPWPAF